MITNKEIVETYLSYRGMKRTNVGKKDNTCPLMPFFIMDAAYQVFCKDIKPIKCKFEMKRAKNRWADSYHRFNMSFFLAFNQEQTDYIIDKMDEFGDYIHNSIVMLKSVVMDEFTNDTPFEEKKILASLLVCNVLEQAAQHLHMEMYRKLDMTGEVNPYIENVKKASFDMACYYPHTKGVDLTSSDKVMAMIDSFCKKTINFLNIKSDET